MAIISSKHWFTILKLSVFFVFIGRAYQFMFFGSPFKAILKDEGLMSPIVKNLTDHTWIDYAKSVEIDHWIDFFTKSCSFYFYLLRLPLYVGKRSRQIF